MSARLNPRVTDAQLCSSNETQSSAPDRAALVVAHPGHELRAFGWAVRTRPLTFVLTQGDGHGGVSRLASTSQVLDGIGARRGSIYGRFNDTALYDALLREDYEPLLRTRNELAETFVLEGITRVACDAEEWYNPSHDVCRYLAMSAAHLAERCAQMRVAVFDFPLVGPPDLCPDALRARAIRLELDDETFARKLDSARRYPELKAEVDRALAANGADAFRVECLRPATDEYSTPPSPPFYEQYGEQQVRAGYYRDVIRFDPHVRGLRDALAVSATAEA